MATSSERTAPRPHTSRSSEWTALAIAFLIFFFAFFTPICRPWLPAAPTIGIRPTPILADAERLDGCLHIGNPHPAFRSGSSRPGFTCWGRVDEQAAWGRPRHLVLRATAPQQQLPPRQCMLSNATSASLSPSVGMLSTLTTTSLASRPPPTPLCRIHPDGEGGGGVGVDRRAFCTSSERKEI